MRHHTRSESTPSHDALTLAAATWLACGLVLFGLTPLPWRDAALGWSPAFWLLAAPCLVLTARQAFVPRTHAVPQCAARSAKRKNVQALRRRKTGNRPGGHARRAA
jgi:hypothetical protein